MVKDPHVRMALRLQAAFRLRQTEAIKFAPSYADRGDGIVVKGSTAKGGRPRSVLVLAGGGALILPGRNYAEQGRVYEEQRKRRASTTCMV